jgi:hypothetical protein
MKRFLFLSFLFTAFSFTVIAQENYLYPEFTSGKIYYKESAILALVNYNLFSSEIIAMDGNKIKRLENIDRIEYISIDNKRFIPLNDYSFGEILIDGGLTLAVKYSGNVQKADEDVKSISKMALNKLLNSGETLPSGITITKDISYYFVKQKNEKKTFYLPGANVEKATRTGIIKLFMKKKSEINLFIDNYNIDFSSLESLKQLVEYCEKFTE